MSIMFKVVTFWLFSNFILHSNYLHYIVTFPVSGSWLQDLQPIWPGELQQLPPAQELRLPVYARTVQDTQAVVSFLQCVWKAEMVQYYRRYSSDSDSMLCVDGDKLHEICMIEDKKYHGKMKDGMDWYWVTCHVLSNIYLHITPPRGGMSHVCLSFH